MSDSPSAQVQGNRESQRRQYELLDVARRRGFCEVEVIDNDRGRFASGRWCGPALRCFQNNTPMSSGCIVDFVTPGVDDGLAIDVGNEGRQAFVEFVFGADADVAQDRTREL